MILLGTFIIKRFSTPFSVGFLLGLILFVAQQQLMLAVTFWRTQYGNFHVNVVFSNLSFTLFILYSFFAVILYNYKDDIMVAPVDVKAFGKRKTAKKNTTAQP